MHVPVDPSEPLATQVLGSACLPPGPGLPTVSAVAVQADRARATSAVRTR